MTLNEHYASRGFLATARLSCLYLYGKNAFFLATIFVFNLMSHFWCAATKRCVCQLYILSFVVDSLYNLYTSMYKKSYNKWISSCTTSRES